MTKSIASLLALALAGLMPAPAAAQTEEAPSAAEAPAAAAPADAPTVESLQADLSKLQARHDEEIKSLREEMSRRDTEEALAQEREAMERDRSIRVYGFADVGAMRTLAPEDPVMASKFSVPLSFYLGRVNLYYDVRPSTDFRFLAETRLSVYPNGSNTGTDPMTGTVQRTSTEVYDEASSNPASKVSWSSIILERAVLDWTRYPLLSVRAGLFLTPFGIYNVDHGTPTLIPISLPVYIGQGWIPERQIGLQLFGSLPVDRWELGYALTVSNGKTDNVLDTGDLKAFGGRLFAKRQGELRLILGMSGLYQPFRKDREQFGLSADMSSYTFTRTRIVEFNRLTLGNDIAIDYRGLRVRNELVYLRTVYTAGKRDAPSEARGGFMPDSHKYNWSILVAYRVWQIEPYARNEFFFSSPREITATYIVSPGLGVNVYFRPNVILKVAWTHPRFYMDDDPDKTAARQNFHTFSGILTCAF